MRVQLLPNVIRKNTPNEYKYLLLDKNWNTIKTLSVSAEKYIEYATDVKAIKQLCWAIYNPNQLIEEDKQRLQEVEKNEDLELKEIEKTAEENIIIAETKEEATEAVEQMEVQKEEIKEEAQTKKATKWKKK